MRKSLLSLFLALFAITMIGCGSDGDSVDVTGLPGLPGGGGGSTGNANLRLAYLSPNGPNVDIFVNGNKVVSNAAFESVSNYLQVPVGSNQIEVRATGTTVNIYEATIPLGVDTYASAAITGVAGNLSATGMADNVVPDPQVLKIRFFNAVPNSGPLTLTDGNGLVLAGPQSFGTASQYISIPNTFQTKSYQLRNSQGRLVAEYSTVRGGNGGLIDAIEGAATTGGLNISVFATGDAVTSLPLLVALDQANSGSQTFISDPVGAILPTN